MWVEKEERLESEFNEKKLIGECLKMETELKRLERDWQVKEERNVGQHNRLSEEEVAMLRGRQLGDGHWQVISVQVVKKCRVELGDVMNKGEEREMERTGRERNENQADLVNDKFQCPHPGCGRKYTTKKILRRHMNVHTNKYQCQVCSKCFSQSNELPRHFRIHTGERPFACDRTGCERRFTTKDNLREHVNYKHSDQRPFQCEENSCGKQFKIRNALQRHMKRVHTFQPTFRCQVEECEFRTKTQADLRRHQAEVHSGI